MGAGQVFGGAIIKRPGEPRAQSVSGDTRRVPYSDLQVMERRVTATATCQDADDFDVVWLQQVHHPPGRWLGLGLRAVLVLVQDREVAVVGVPRVPAANTRTLVRRLPVRHVHRCLRLCARI